MPADQFGAKPYSNPTPTVPPKRVELAEATPTPPNRGEYVITIARHRHAALHVQQRRIPGITELAGEKA
jgi:hypothetical protein